MACTDCSNYPKLEQDIHVDLAIIGGGISGITLAYLLKHCGQKVALFEAESIVEEMKTYSPTTLSLQSYPIYHQLVHQKSPGKAKQYADANKSTLQFIRKLIKEEHMLSDLVEVPSYIYTIEEKNVHLIKNELEACKRLGIESDYRTEVPMNLPVRAALEFRGAALFYPQKYTLKLAQRFVEAGGKIYEKTPIQQIKAGKKEAFLKNKISGRSSGVTLITSDNKQIEAGAVVITSQFGSEEVLGTYLPKEYKRMCYTLEVALKANDLPRGSFRSIDETNYSIKPVYENKSVFITERTPSKKEKEVIYSTLSEFASHVFQAGKVGGSWAVEEHIATDRLPYIGYLNNRVNQSVYLATGFKRGDMLQETNAAMILKDLLLIGRNDYEEVFNPKRQIKLNLY